MCVSFELVNHGGRWGNTAQAIDRWQHPVASSEALDVLYWAMCPASYRRIAMATEIASNLPVFLLLLICCCPLP
jgi:hypothetical protein